MHEYLPGVRNGQPFEVLLMFLEENFWNGRRTVQMRLKDIHLKVAAELNLLLFLDRKDGIFCVFQKGL